MGIFKRRTVEIPPQDRTAWVTAQARRLLAERGVETTIVHGATPADVALAATDGTTFPLFNALAKTEGRTSDEAVQIIAGHLDGALAGQQSPSPSTLTAEELRRQVRTRLLSDSAGPDQPSFQYAVPFSDGIVTALCVDFPQSISFLSDADFEKCALSADELFAFGQDNTDREKIDERFEPAPGVHVITGDSFFTASKATNLPAVFGPAPFGTLFTVPYRHALVALPITGPETLSAVENLIGYTRHVLGSGLAPGGVISAEVHFSRDGVVSRVSSTDEAGAVSINVDERLQHALEQAVN